MTTLQVDTPYWQSTLWLAIVGVGSGMFNSPNTAAMMGAVPAKRRGIAAGARTLLQNTGAVLSIAFVLAIITSAVPKSTLFAVFSGLAKGLSAQKLAPFIDNMHTALWVLAATSLVGAGGLPDAPAPRQRRRSRLRDEPATERPAERTSELVRGRRMSALRPPREPRTRGTTPRATEPGGRDRPRGRSPKDPRRRAAAHRRRRAPRRHDAAHDPLLRGDRPAARGRRAPVGPAPHVHRGRGRAPARGDAPQAPARA